ncbi:LysE/ArgO family amino acid transporter [Heyndrickxia ginsengihumi]|uniref:Amino acid transporter n=1 Tax=Heyndrickxia ginsengihumi TaxID=363870 RepID=A0A6M0PAA4_9BACI|nr:LysE/ArgO family amino acid transporter [Heyndrickxia ginsengihumi]MCM3023401.1 LysE/ArgO family amino acid transporter [Heyndrickxia ginsengihumi]NEY21337.1 amino acid transporter [Heyndrickxia ginsengihumi]
MEPLIHGIILSFGLILPLGAQNVFVFNQGTVHKHIIYALPAIITAGLCDTILIFIAVAGVSIIMLQFVWLRMLLLIIGVCFLAYIGYALWKSSSNINTVQQPQHFSMKRQIVYAASVSLLNPHAMLDTVGVIGTNSLMYTGFEKWLYTIACISVSWVWFFSLAMIGRKVGQIDQKGHLLKRMNQVSAFIIWGTALFMGAQLFSLK